MNSKSSLQIVEITSFSLIANCRRRKDVGSCLKAALVKRIADVFWEIWLVCASLHLIFQQFNCQIPEKETASELASSKLVGIFLHPDDKCVDASNIQAIEKDFVCPSASLSGTTVSGYHLDWCVDSTFRVTVFQDYSKKCDLRFAMLWDSSLTFLSWEHVNTA